MSVFVSWLAGRSCYEELGEEQDFSDTVTGDIDIHRTLGATVLHVPMQTYEDRPITPLKDKMVYSTVQSSLDFEDGKTTVAVD